MTDADLGVYLVCYNEDLVIGHSYKALAKVFPQVKVIDLGSTDNSLRVLRKLGAHVLRDNIMTEPVQAGCWDDDAHPARAYTALKSYYVESHEWAFWVDGDEVYPEEELRKITPMINEGDRDCYCISSRYATHDNGRKVIYDKKDPSGPKVLRGDLLRWHRAWPKEYLVPRDPATGFARGRVPRLWCWHLRFMDRSSHFHDTARDNRRKTDSVWLRSMKGTEVDQFPWEVS